MTALTTGPPGAATSWSARSKATPSLRRYLRRTSSGLLRIDRAATTPETHLDGKWLRRTSDETLTAEDLAEPYRQLVHIEYQLAGHEERARAAPGVSPPRGPHPRPRPTVLAGAAAHPGRRKQRHRHLAQPCATS
jgi:hypothetical protein